jgi:hypothetical protein
VDELRREGKTVLLTTQYLDEADRLAQRIGSLSGARWGAVVVSLLKVVFHGLGFVRPERKGGDWNRTRGGWRRRA